jgi:hypothetical protein
LRRPSAGIFLFTEQLGLFTEQPGGSKPSAFCAEMA